MNGFTVNAFRCFKIGNQSDYESSFPHDVTATANANFESHRPGLVIADVEKNPLWMLNAAEKGFKTIFLCSFGALFPHDLANCTITDFFFIPLLQPLVFLSLIRRRIGDKASPVNLRQ